MLTTIEEWTTCDQIDQMSRSTDQRKWCTIYSLEFKNDCLPPGLNTRYSIKDYCAGCSSNRRAIREIIRQNGTIEIGKIDKNDIHNVIPAINARINARIDARNNDQYIVNRRQSDSSVEIEEYDEYMLFALPYVEE